jgi:hypothetical protein
MDLTTAVLMSVPLGLSVTAVVFRLSSVIRLKAEIIVPKTMLGRPPHTGPTCEIYVASTIFVSFRPTVS